MRALISEAEQYFEDLFVEYRNVLESDHSVTTAKEYLSFCGAYDRLEDPSVIFQYLDSEEIGVDAFLECPPLLGQDIVYASMNPAMKSTIRQKEFESGQYGRILSCEGDLEAIAWKWARDFRGYLTHSSNPGPRKIIQTLRESLDGLPDSGEIDYEDYVTVEDREDLPGSYYGDVYHTQFFRLPSPKGGFLDQFGDRDHWRETFAEELRIADPKLIISGCKDVWLTILDYLVEDPEEEIITHQGSEITRKYSNRADPTAVYKVYEIPSQDRWIVTSFQESRYSFLKPELLRENLEYVNERISL